MGIEMMNEYEGVWLDRGETIDIFHKHTYPLIHCECGMSFVLIGVAANTIFDQVAPPFCPYCGKAMETKEDK
jgi:hypothetical protein